MKKHTDNQEDISKASPCTKLKRAGQAYKDGYTCSQVVFMVYAKDLMSSLGDSKGLTYSLVCASILNILLDLLFVIVLHWGVAGVA